MPKLTEQDIADRLEEVKLLKFQLDPDPTKLGLNSLLLKLAEVQMLKSRISAILTEAMTNVAIAEIEKEEVQSEYDRKLEYYMVSDDEVKNQKSAEQRNFHAKVKMTKEVLALHAVEIALIKATWYQKILSSVYSDLDSANSNLSRQISVIQLEQNISSGGLNRGTIKQINI